MVSDRALARRLEKAEGQSSADFVETRARLFPGSGAQWITVAGAYAIFDGASSPLTQTFGLGLSQAVTGADLARIEAFFCERGAPVFHEVSPLADLTLLAQLNERGYQPVEFTSVMFRPLRPDLPLTGAHPKKIQVRLLQGEEHELWAQTAARGTAEF